MGAGVRGGVISLDRDGKEHLLDPLKLDEMKAALGADSKKGPKTPRAPDDKK